MDATCIVSGEGRGSCGQQSKALPWMSLSASNLAATKALNSLGQQESAEGKGKVSGYSGRRPAISKQSLLKDAS